MAERKLRFRGLKTDTWTVSNTRQIGPDADLKAWETRRRTQAADDGKVFYAKTGSDSAAGTRAAPKLTPQAAIDAAVAASKTGIACCDTSSQQYNCGQLDIKGMSLFADAGITPTLSFGLDSAGSFPAFGVSTGVTAAARNLVKFALSGVDCLYVATSAGLYRSTDGKTWTVAAGSGHDITGCCVHQGVLYYADKTAATVYSVTSAGTVAAFATVAQMGATGATLNGGVWSAGSKLLVDLADGTRGLAWYTGAAWAIGTETRTDPFRRIAYLAAVSDTTAFACTTTGAAAYTVDLTSSVPIVALVSMTDATRDIFAIGSRIYRLTPSAVQRLLSGTAPSIWTSVFGANITFSTPQAFWVDESGYYNVLHLSGGTYCVAVSKDAGLTLALKSSSLGSIGSTGTLAGCIETLGDVVVTTSSAGIKAWDRRQVIDSTDTVWTIINGYIIDGLGIASTQLPKYTGLEYCRAQKAHRPWPQVVRCGVNQFSRFCDFLEVGKLLSDYGFPTPIYMYYCEFYRIKNDCLQVSHGFVMITNCTLYACGTALILDTEPQNIGGLLIFKSTVCDIVSKLTSWSGDEYNGGIRYAFYNTSTGLVKIAYKSYSGDPLFVDPDNADFRFKSRALGYALDSGLISAGLGARGDSRSISTTTYGLDYMLRINPKTVTPAYQPAEYSRNFSSDGSLYARESNPGKHKVSKKLVFDGAAGTDNDPLAQASWLRFIFGLDTVLDIGETETGTSFTPLLTLHLCWIGSDACYGYYDVGSIADNPTCPIAPNQFAGAYCSWDRKIISHGAAFVDSRWPDRWTLYLPDFDRMGYVPNPLGIEMYRRYRIDKSQPFSPASPVPFSPGILPAIPTTCELTICEVDE